MRRHSASKLVLAGACAMAVAAFGVGAAGCAPKANPGNPTPRAEKAATTPATDKYGIVEAKEWKDIYPHQYDSYLQNADNTPPWDEYSASEDTTSAMPDGYTPTDSHKADYLQEYPEIKILGNGYGYAKYYTEPAGHTYSLWTITHNGRVNEQSKAQCITCKTPQFSAEVNRTDGKIFQANLFDTVKNYTENISCASCHGNDPTTLRVDRRQWLTAMGKDHKTASMQGQVCGQCHCDYSMDAKTGEPTSPYYGGVKSMVPDKALQWYDEHGYVDWVYPTTGAKMLAVRHAEYEFNYGGDGNHMTNLGYDCNDCHMAPKFADDGTAYSDHHWTSPLDNQELIDRDCSKCHKDLKAEVKQIQTDIDGRTHKVGLREANFVQNFEKAIEGKSITAKQKKRLQKIQRDAGYYWNFASAENSEGAHNPQLYTEVLDKADKLMDEADKILGVSSEVSDAQLQANTTDQNVGASSASAQASSSQS